MGPNTVEQGAVQKCRTLMELLWRRGIYHANEDTEIVALCSDALDGLYRQTGVFETDRDR